MENLNEITEQIRTLVEEVREIARYKYDDNTCQIGWQKLKRWEQRVVSFLEEFSRVEAQKFIDLHVGLAFAQPYTNLKRQMQAKETFLQTLAEEFTKYPSYWKEQLFKNSTPSTNSLEKDDPMIQKVQEPRNVFVVHGRNLKARDAISLFLYSINLRPLEWSTVIAATGKPSPYIGEVLDTAFTMAQAIVILFTPDDMAFLREELREAGDPPHETQPTPQARPNVIFEAGMAMGRSPERTVLVELGTIRPFTDISGIHVIKLNDTSTRRQDFAQRLQSAGCPIDISGTNWHNAGKFNLE